MLYLEIKTRIAILEIGNYYDAPDIIKAFSEAKKAIKNIPSGFKKVNSPAKYYYEDKIKERWLSIKEYEIEE